MQTLNNAAHDHKNKNIHAEKKTMGNINGQEISLQSL